MLTQKSSIISVRVDEGVKQKLSSESEMNSVTMNTLISQILRKHVEWDCYAEDVGLVFLTKPFLREVLKEVDEDTLSNIAVNTCKDAIRDAITFIQGDLNIQTLLKGLDLWFKASHIPFRHITSESNDKYIIQHELGKKYSIHIINVVNAILNEIDYKIISQEADEQSVIFQIEKIN